MTFLVAWRLGLLVVVGVFAGAWIAALRQRRRDVVRFTDVALLDVVAPERSPWRRHVPAALWLAALTLLIVGFARPARDMDVSRQTAAMVIAIDVSLSMDADDVPPTRLAAAQEAATDFVEGLPSSLDVGLVLFSGSVTGYPPTGDHDQVLELIQNAELGPYTAIGDALFESLDLVQAALPETDPDELPDDGTTLPPGRIVLLGDGETTIGRSNEDAAAAAAAAGIPVDTISFGTPHGSIVTEEGRVEPVPAAPEALREISETTGGDFFEAESMEALADAYQNIGTLYATEREQRELGGWFLGAGLLFLIVAGGLSLLWAQRLP